jgi:hypothetical protein
MGSLISNQQFWYLGTRLEAKLRKVNLRLNRLKGLGDCPKQSCSRRRLFRRFGRLRRGSHAA